MTPPERRLWNALKLRPDGFKFRKQHEHGPYYLDFYCYNAAVAVEVDGLAHELGANPRDERRDAWLATRGIHTVRVRATDVRDNLEGVVVMIVEECRARTSNLLPLDLEGRWLAKRDGGALLKQKRDGPSTSYAGPPPLQMQGRRGDSLAVDQVIVEFE